MQLSDKYSLDLIRLFLLVGFSLWLSFLVIAIVSYFRRTADQPGKKAVRKAFALYGTHLVLVVGAWYFRLADTAALGVLVLALSILLWAVVLALYSRSATGSRLAVSAIVLLIFWVASVFVPNY
jgi:hypothetical protein